MINKKELTFISKLKILIFFALLGKFTLIVQRVYFSLSRLITKRASIKIFDILIDEMASESNYLLPAEFIIRKS